MFHVFKKLGGTVEDFKNFYIKLWDMKNTMRGGGGRDL